MNNKPHLKHLRSPSHYDTKTTKRKERPSKADLYIQRTELRKTNAVIKRIDIECLNGKRKITQELTFV